MKDEYEQYLSIYEIESLSEKKYSVTKPVFEPMVLDGGYSEVTGFDTSFSMCYKLQRLAAFYIFHFTTNGSWAMNPDATFLKVYVSFSNHVDYKYLDWQRGVTLSMSDALSGCLEFQIDNLHKYDFSLSRKSNFLCEKEDSCYMPYNQGYCLDLCVQKFILNQAKLDASYR